MKEIIELRVLEEHAHLLFDTHEGTRLGPMVRKVKLPADDPRLKRVAQLDREFSAGSGYGGFFLGWNIQREYTRAELTSARLFHLKVGPEFDPVGEQCGTIYDEAVACKYCGAGRQQISPLRLDVRRLPRARGIAQSLAGELVVSGKGAEKLNAAGLVGFRLSPVEHIAKRRTGPLDLASVPAGRALLEKATLEGLTPDSGEFFPWLNQPAQAAELRRAQFQADRAEHAQDPGAERAAAPWYQVIVQEPRIAVVLPTRFGVHPFDDDLDRAHVCPLGHTAGLNVLSEVHTDHGLPSGIDIAASDVHVGVHRGVLRPRRLLLVSPRFVETLRDHGIKGWRAEVAHVGA